MALSIQSLDRTEAHPMRPPVSTTGNTGSDISAASSTPPTGDSAPSFSAVFAQIAAAAAAAGTTVASIAPPAGGAAPPTPVIPAQTATPAVAATSSGASSSSTSQVQTATATSPVAATTPAATLEAQDGPAGPLFGANPWLTAPTGSGPGGQVTYYNPVYFATQQTAQTVAQMLGGTVVQDDQITTAPGSPFQQNQPNYMVQLANGGLVNPGFIADIYTHGWNQTFINQQVANEVNGATPVATNT